MSTDSGSTTSSDTSPSASADTWSSADFPSVADLQDVVDAERLLDRERPSVEHSDLENVPLTHVDTRTGDRCGYVDEQELLVREVGGDRVGEHLSPEEFHESGRFQPIA